MDVATAGGTRAPRRREKIVYKPGSARQALFRDQARTPGPIEPKTGKPLCIDAIATPDQLRHIATLLPDEWLAASAQGTPAECAARVAGQFDLGADGVILHGATPDELAPVVAAYRDIRDADRFAGRSANPGRGAVVAR